MSYVAKTAVSVADNKGRRHTLAKGDKVPAAVPVPQCRDLATVGLLTYVGSADLGAVPAANNTAVPKKAATLPELRGYVVDADLATAEEAAKLQKAELRALIEKPADPPPADPPTVGEEGGQGPQGTDAAPGDGEA